jgi:hypothetical protein
MDAKLIHSIKIRLDAVLFFMHILLVAYSSARSNT